MFADFRKGTTGTGTGTSFKGALAYFLNDKGEAGEHLTTDERVDVLELRNLATDQPRQAWFEMMNTAEASDTLKAAAGVKKGGRPGTKPVFAYYLAWHDSERPDRAEMLDAARSSLRTLGLLDHQALIVSHTDTDSPHVHIIVNRVNPEDGRYAGLSNSWKTLKDWATDYSKARGTHWHIAREQAKQAHQARNQTRRQAGFNAGATATPVPSQIPTPAPRPATRAEWQARKTADNDRRAGEAAAAAALKATLNAKWQALKAAEHRATEQQFTETSQYREDRQALRNAIYAKFEEAYKAIWTPGARRPAAYSAPPDNATLHRLVKNHRSFMRNEGNVFGRLLNARRLAKGASILTIARLALNGSERLRRFDLVQRQITSEGRWGKKVAQNVRAGFAPEPKKFQAERLKQMRTEELRVFDRETQQERRGLTTRHWEQLDNLKAVRAALSAEGKAAWANHSATYRRPAVAKEQEQPGRVQPTPARTQAEPERVQETDRPREAVQDRYGRSRDRKSRQPRAERQQRTTTPADGKERAEGASEAGREAGTAATFNREAHAPPEAEQGPQSALERAEAAYVFTPAEIEAEAEAKARHAAEREANERDGDERGFERER